MSFGLRTFGEKSGEGGSAVNIGRVRVEPTSYGIRHQPPNEHITRRQTRMILPNNNVEPTYCKPRGTRLDRPS